MAVTKVEILARGGTAPGFATFLKTSFHIKSDIGIAKIS